MQVRLADLEMEVRTASEGKKIGPGRQTILGWAKIFLLRHLQKHHYPLDPDANDAFLVTKGLDAHSDPAYTIGDPRSINRKATIHIPMGTTDIALARSIAAKARQQVVPGEDFEPRKVTFVRGGLPGQGQEDGKGH